MAVDVVRCLCVYNLYGCDLTRADCTVVRQVCFAPVGPFCFLTFMGIFEGAYASTCALAGAPLSLPLCDSVGLSKEQIKDKLDKVG